MRKVLIYSTAALLVIGSVGIASAQMIQRQHSGFGTGVGESQGTGSRSQIWDTTALLERLAQPETVFGLVFGKDLPSGRIHLQTAAGGTSAIDQGRAGANTAAVMTLYIDDQTNMQQIAVAEAGDYVAVTVREETTEAQPFGTGRKLVRDIQVIRNEATMQGFGGLGQRPDPATEAGIVTQSASIAGAVVGEVMPGSITGEKGHRTNVGTYTGAAPCWNCEPQPGWGYGELGPGPEAGKTTKSNSDYLSGGGTMDDLNFSKK